MNLVVFRAIPELFDDRRLESNPGRSFSLLLHEEDILNERTATDECSDEVDNVEETAIALAALLVDVRLQLCFHFRFKLTEPLSLAVHPALDDRGSHRVVRLKKRETFYVDCRVFFKIKN